LRGKYMRVPASLYLRVRSATGAWIYIKPAKSPNHKLKPLYGIVDGAAKRCPEGSYHLRYRVDGKRVWESVGTDADLATVALQRKAAELTAAEPEPPKVEPKGSGRPIKDAVIEYLAETKADKSKKTLAAYRTTLKLFQESCQKADLEDIDRKDMLAFKAFLKAEPHCNAPRTVRNRIDYLQIFLHHFGLPSILKGKDLPTYTEKKVRAYSAADLHRMLGVSDQEESDRLNFLLCTGTREQEAQYACWSDIDLDARTYTVTEHLDLGFKPKDKEEGTIPIPSFLVDMLRARRERYPAARLVFPTPENRPDGHLLRLVKSVGLRAGLNCGHCVNKAGKSCATHPVCKHVILHKLRKTFASVLSKKGIPARTIMRYLRHSDLTTTLRYLDDQDDDNTRAIVETAFLQTGGAL
jgi:integrase/recombinase XerD